MIKIKGYEYLNTREAALLAGIQQETLRSYFRKGVFKTLRKEKGTRYHVFRGEIIKFRDGKISVAGIYKTKGNLNG